MWPLACLGARHWPAPLTFSVAMDHALSRKRSRAQSREVTGSVDVQLGSFSLSRIITQLVKAVEIRLRMLAETAE